MSDSNRMSILRVREATFGVTPPTPTMIFTRFTGESLRQETQTVQSQEIRSDRQIPDIVRVGLSGAGDLNGELSYGAYNDLLESSLFSAAFSSQIVVGSLTLTVSAGAGTVTRSAGSWTTDGFTLYSWVKFTGFANPANNGYFKITVITTTVLTLQGGTTRLVTEGPLGSCTATQAGEIKNGVLFTSYAIEKRYEDLASEFAILNGFATSGLRMEVTSDGIITLGFSFLGKKEASASATAATATTPAPTEEVMNAVDDVKLVTEGGGIYDVTRFSLQIENNLRNRLQVATLGAISIGAGTIDVSGTIQAYYNSKAVMDKYLNFTQSGFALVVVRNAKGYVIDVPAIKYTTGQRVAGGINTDIIADVAFRSKRESAEGVTIRIAAFS